MAPGERTPTANLSWNRGPAESRFVRLLLYPAVGVSYGLVLGFVALFGPPFVARFAHGVPPWLLLGAVVAVVYFGPMLLAGVLTSRARRERYPRASEWADVTRSVPSLVAVGLVTTAIVGAGLLFDWSIETYLGVSFGGILVAQALGALAWFLGSAGEIDPDAGELRVANPGRDDVDLGRLSGVKRLSLGEYTLLWLLVSKSDGGGPDGGQNARTGGPGQDIYAIPTAVVERAWPVFEQGMARGTGSEAGESASSVLRKVNLFIAVVFLAGGVGALAFFAWLGLPEWQLLQSIWLLSGVGYFFLRFLARTY